MTPIPKLQAKLRQSGKCATSKNEYNVKGAVLYVDSKPVAMTLGSEISPKVYDINLKRHFVNMTVFMP